MTIPYAEIGITTNFSFLRGGSHPQEYVHQAAALKLSGVGIADHNTLAGIVRAYSELDNPDVQPKPKLLIGARLVFSCGTPTYASVLIGTNMNARPTDWYTRSFITEVKSRPVWSVCDM